jgi:hypothetical protein
MVAPFILIIEYSTGLLRLLATCSLDHSKLLKLFASSSRNPLDLEVLASVHLQCQPRPAVVHHGFESALNLLVCFITLQSDGFTSCLATHGGGRVA